MLKLPNHKNGIAMPFVIFFMAAIGFSKYALADEAAVNSVSSLNAIQIYCMAEQGDVSESDADFTEVIVNLAASNDPAQRVNALSQLAVKGSIESGILQKILQAAIQDTNPQVRGQAVYAFAQQDCGDLFVVLEQALQDTELSVRLMALDSLGDDARSVALLQQVVEDENEAQAIKDLADMKLEALSANNRTQKNGI
ncbi:HEAT repeat domain-containing protein [Nitrosomonas ureae]|uniref:HEAT repeat-containing protein n=1 Tax=Nitrosomonas ureae TaxID=44577 RepID=A0A1H9H4W0_9PROT|nr:HEAT repeat domain-containing protein [Nitrosomonas ureae]PXX16654.1 HEAT repeat protein [Nitrosomonas ureae]SEQ57267.1 HEAT repeat-containing protein [Nitrosomonas ureae]